MKKYVNFSFRVEYVIHEFRKEIKIIQMVDRTKKELLNTSTPSKLKLRGSRVITEITIQINDDTTNALIKNIVREVRL